jgi:hypothetical protein
MHFLDGQKKRAHMDQLLKKEPYVHLPMECACQKHGCLNKTTHAVWQQGKHSFLLRPLCPKCYEAGKNPLPTAPIAKAPVAKPESTPKVKDKKPEDKPKQQGITNEELSRRIAQLEEVPFKQRTMAEAQELNDLLILRKQRARKK